MSGDETTKRGTQKGHEVEKERVCLVEARRVNSSLESLDGDYLVVITDKSPKKGESILIERGETMELSRYEGLEDPYDKEDFRGVVAATIKLDP